jgi:hypothetical protein
MATAEEEVRTVVAKLKKKQMMHSTGIQETYSPVAPQDGGSVGITAADLGKSISRASQEEKVLNLKRSFHSPETGSFHFYSPISCHFQSLVSLYVTDRDWRLQCCQGTEILASKLKKGRKKSWRGQESQGRNFFASGRIFWLI